MDSAGKDDVINKGQAFADKAADKTQSGISEVKDGVNAAASSASKKVDSIRSGAGHALEKTADKTQGVFDGVSDAAQKAKDFASDMQDSIVSYTREQPVKALMIAAAVGAVLITTLRALSASRES